MRSWSLPKKKKVNIWGCNLYFWIDVFLKL